MPSLRLTETEVGPDRREIRIDGELDLAVAAELREMIERVMTPQTLIDLRDCDFIDSSGIAVLVQAHHDAVRAGATLIVHSPRGQVKRMLDLTGLSENSLVFASREQALRHL